MSAILGCVHFSQRPVDPRAFQRALSLLADYGREGAFAHVDSSIALGFQRLDISPESVHERLPLVEEGLCLVADAILDNRDELCDRLAIDRSQRAAVPDGRLLLLAYRRWGRDCVAELVGDFAFAIWDAKRHCLFCARDHVGSRPLYYCEDKWRVLFATDMRALLAFPDIEPHIDEDPVASYLFWPFDSHEVDFFTNIHHLPAGHWLEAGPAGVRLERYWHPEAVEPVRYPQRDDYVANLRELLETAVRARVRTHYPIGSHLSGGLDSSGVTLLAAQLLHEQGRRLDQVYTWSPPIGEAYPRLEEHRDERILIDRLCRQAGTECHYGTASAEDLRHFLNRDMAVEGTTDLFEEWPVMAHAGGRGTRVLLSGWGGDEAVTFSLRGYPAHLVQHGRWLSLLSLARHRSGGLRHGRRLLHFLWQQGLVPLLPDALYARFSPFRWLEGVEEYAPERFRQRFSDLKRRRMPAWREVSGPSKMQALLLTNGHLSARMATWAHWAAPHGLIHRYPWMDKRLLQFVLGLPPELLWQDGEVRWLYRRALGDLLPAKIAKQDPVNERKRQAISWQGWKELARELTDNEAASEGCEWIDQHVFRACLENVPKTAGPEAALQAVNLMRAFRVWKLWCSYGQNNKQRQKLAFPESGLTAARE
ncbi:asparagine synthase-related protein [Billgrantia kenyensis]|uniref:asparagine synthase (glutamine-hydrolyzing) n=1 Tax=Billgrantia kenyensis TaxID=321266 RepID=A0A7V9W366_9GAMM|nr:asparagine synthase-related protein [Halomonas kenyensis]MBA2780242.1 hypothetical protein [Halomonas kenyensis]MCG6663102.1 hypothetical protein [Halomonas kenyensis]